jgi:hypothetical protein
MTESPPHRALEPCFCKACVTERKRLLRDGTYSPLSVAALEQLTEQAWIEGSFAMRLLAGEVWRLRRAVIALEDELARERLK